MDRSRLEVTPGVWLDHRRALFLEEHGTLCIADPHIGYAWAHRYAGQLLPVVKKDDTADRLEELCACYKPSRSVILGDIVHRAVPRSQVKSELCAFLQRASSCTCLELLLGNHDRGLERVLPPHVRTQTALDVGEYTLVHGDATETSSAKKMIMGHEHPAISLGDGVKGAKFPCFVHGPVITILPAFSSWAAGADIRRGSYMSTLAQCAELTQAIAIMGDRLLPVALGVPRRCR